MKSIFKLINAYNFKGFVGPFFAILFPVLIMVLMGSATYSTTLSSLKNSFVSESIIEEKMLEFGRGIIAGVLISSVISNGLIGFPAIILEFKKTTLIKRIGSTNIKPLKFAIAALLYQSIWLIFSILWIPTTGLLILGFNKYMNYSIAFNINFWTSIPFVFLTFLISISLGMAIISLVQSYRGASSISNLIYFPISFLSGGFGTGRPNFEYVPAINYFSYVLPTKYSTELYFSSLKFGIENLYNELGWTSYGYVIISFIIVVIFLFIVTKKFKWGE